MPKKIRKRFAIEAGTTLEWSEQGNALRVVKLERPKQSGFLRALKRLGSVPIARRKRDRVRYTS